ncbi:MAG: hypothetical protein WA160_15075 [Pseudobdellovibrio sp.]
MTEMILIHRSRNGNPLAGVVNQLNTATINLMALWSTCLREILFISSGDFSKINNLLVAEDEIISGSEVFPFLIETVCGLKSPLVGETEVQGQFKKFISDLPDSNPIFWGFYSSFFQSVLSETKHVRTTYLKNLGSQSYGSLIRRRLDENASVAILGAGHLTQEILPWMKTLKQIDIYARDQQKAEKFKDGFPQVCTFSWPGSPNASVIVIAAPISNEKIISNLAYLNTKKIIDLRGEATLDFEQLQSMGLHLDNYESLQGIVSEMNQDKVRINSRVHDAKTSIRKCGEAFGNRALSRPGGWDDLC